MHLRDRARINVQSRTVTHPGNGKLFLRSSSAPGSPSPKSCRFCITVPRFLRRPLPRPKSGRKSIAQCASTGNRAQDALVSPGTGRKNLGRRASCAPFRDWLIGDPAPGLCALGFHEKAGRCQGKTAFWFSSGGITKPAIPSSLKSAPHRSRAPSRPSAATGGSKRAEGKP